MVNDGAVVDGVVYGPDLNAEPLEVTLEATFGDNTASNCISFSNTIFVVPAVAIKDVGPPPYEVIW